jgi:hypothetical protein
MVSSAFFCAITKRHMRRSRVIVQYESRYLVALRAPTICLILSTGLDICRKCSFTSRIGLPAQ